MKITKRQLRRIIKEEKARVLNESITEDDIDAMGGVDFSLTDGDMMNVDGSLLDPAALRRLAEVLEALYTGRPVPHQEEEMVVEPGAYIVFDVD